MENKQQGDNDLAAANPQSAVRSMETTHKSKVVVRCKVVIVGDAAVGKSAITQMFHGDGHGFPKNYLMTLGVDFCVKVVKIPDSNVDVEMYLYDSAGQSVFNQRELGTKHWEGATVVMAVYDCTNQDSFLSTAKWLSAVRSVHDGRPLPGVLVANKTDMREQMINAISSEDGQAFAQQNGLRYFEMSALRNENVDAPFNWIARAIHKKYEEFVARAKQNNARGGY